MVEFHEFGSGNALPQAGRLRQPAFNVAPVAQIVVDARGILVLANVHACAQFGVAASDLGRPLKDLKLSRQLADLSSGIRRASAERQRIILQDVAWRNRSGAIVYWRIDLSSLRDAQGAMVGVHITFAESTPHQRLREEFARARLEVASASLRLHHTNEALQTATEELASMKKELEIMNEELASVRVALCQRTAELAQVNPFVESILDLYAAGQLAGGPGGHPAVDRG
jgi:two-component system CheB/CheR fusion protein